MIQIPDVKRISQQVVESHNNRGYALVKLTPTGRESVGVLVNVTKDPIVLPGKELKAKADVRRFLWERSQEGDASIRRKDRTWVWSRYLAEEDVSLIGLATMADRKVAERLSFLNPDYQFIEVSR
jgi:hypothetical protein